MSSVAVLAFTNMSGDLEQDYFSEGISNDIITELSRSRSLSVISRNSSFTYKGRHVDTKEVARGLGVRYVVEGSVRRGDSRLRVTAQLIDAETGNHIWSERYDRDVQAIFDIQDEITAAVTRAVLPAVSHVEQQRAMRKPPESLSAWEAYQCGLWHMTRGNSNDDKIALNFFQQATELDASCAAGYTGLAYAQVHLAAGFYTGKMTESLKLAEYFARRALSLDGVDAEARACLGLTLHLQGNHEGGRAEVDRALTVSPGLAVAHGILGETLVFSGQMQDGIASLETSVRLDPFGPNARVHEYLQAVGLYFLRQYEAACEAARRAIRSYPEYPPPYRWLAAALGQLGHGLEAGVALQRAKTASQESFDFFTRSRPPWFRPKDHEHMLDGLRKAGWQG
jgi:adenylate cyclase